MDKALQRTVRGKRPAFHESAAIDRLISMVLTLTSEVSVLRDRIDTLEQLGASAGWLEPGAVNAYAPDAAVKASREAERERLIQRVFHIMREELEDLARGDTEEAYWATVERIESGAIDAGPERSAAKPKGKPKPKAKPKPRAATRRAAAGDAS